MISLKNIKKVPERPYYVARKINRMYHSRGGISPHNPAGTRWLDEDWDVLTILDACRYDTFKRVHDLPGKLQSTESIGSSTAPVFRENLDQTRLHDTVFVSAHPTVYNGQRDQLVQREPIRVQFHDQIDVWKDSGWNEKAQTVLPEKMEEYVMDAAKTYRRKRLIIHFLQPHCPFVGEVGRKHYNPEKRDFWGEVMLGQTDKNYLKEGYRENLKTVLPTIRRILNEIEGKHVVTADHGQFLGERARPVPNEEWGHPRGIHTQPVIEVPWLTYQNNNRREIQAESPVNNEAVEVKNEIIRERLSHLGYVQE